MKTIYLGYHYNSVDGQHQNRILKSVEEVNSFLNARASEEYSSDVDNLVASIALMKAGQCKYIDIDHGDWITITQVDVEDAGITDREAIAVINALRVYQAEDDREDIIDDFGLDQDNMTDDEIESLIQRINLGEVEVEYAKSVAKADLIVEEFQSDGLIEYDDKGLKIESDFVCYLEVSSNGEIKLRFVSSYNKAAWASTRICFVDVKGADYGVTFTLSDGDKKMPVRVAYNGTVASGEMLIYSETTFGGAFEAPIGILLTYGKLDVRVWQPEDMGTDPSMVTVIKPYGLYDMEAIACNLKEIGSEKDYDQLFRQKGFNNGEVAATAKIDVDGETYDIVVGVVGDQEVYANYAENEDEEEMLVPLDEDGTQKRLHREPSDLLQAKALESERNKTYLAWRANCWLNIEILKNGDSVGNYGDQFGSSFGSIQECFEAVCEDDIRQMLGKEISKKEKSSACNICCQKDLENALENARVGYYLGILGDEDVWEVLNMHRDIYPFENSFDYYNTEWFVENKEAFVEFIEQVILREAARGV